MTRAEHLQWAKDRALEELDRGQLRDAIASMISDLGKHPELEKSAQVGGLLILTLRTKEDVKRWIEGFN